ncbi:MAG: hypothetical protein AAGA30_09070 [Planctomycetota bacterium]
MKAFQNHNLNLQNARSKTWTNPLDQLDLWLTDTKSIQRNDEISIICRKLEALKYDGDLLIYQHDGLAGRQYHCLLENGVVVRHEYGEANWSIVNGEFYMNTRIDDKSWQARYDFNADRTAFKGTNQNNKTSKGTLVFGDPSSFFVKN